MAQDSVVKNLLTEAMVRAGAELTRTLDEMRWPVFASLWLYVPEGSQWKLVLASPKVASGGPKKAYETIQSALATIPSAEGVLSLSDITVTDPTDQLITLLRTGITTGPTISSGIRFTKNVFNGHFIEDAYVYRNADRAPNGPISGANTPPRITPH